MANTNETPLELFGTNFFSSAYKLDLGIWIARQEIGQPFSVYDAKEALVHRANPNNHESIARRFMPAFESALLIEKTRVTYGAREPHLWERVENRWWEIFELAGHLATE